MAAYSMDLRLRVLRDADAGLPSDELAGPPAGSLNRGGHRHANAALYRAVIVRMRFHQPTRDYVARRTVAEPNARSSGASNASLRESAGDHSGRLKECLDI